MQLDAGRGALVLPVVLPASRWWVWPLEAWVAAHWRGFLQAHAIDVVLAEFGPTGVAVMRLCQTAGMPLVVHFHGHDAYRRPLLAGIGQRYNELFAHAAAIIAVSRDMEQQLLGLGAPRAKLHYNPCGVDTAAFHGANPAQAPPVFLAVGRFVAKKGPQLTLRAFHAVWQRCPEARLLMVGDGPLWGACRRLARQLGLAPAVAFLGPQPHAKVAVLMRHAKAFVQHSRRASDGNAEGTPVAVLEAGASGLPVVATRHGGIRDVVLEETTGLLVDEGDVDGMAAAMLRLLRNPDLATRLGEAARQRVCTAFAMEQRIAHLQQILAAVR
jgi:glycosyltransferase involved in cell wall biosynthesis